MDSQNERGVRLFGVDIITGRPVNQKEAVSTDPQLPGGSDAPNVNEEEAVNTALQSPVGSAETIPSNEDESSNDDDDEVFVLSRLAFEEVLRERRAQSRSAGDTLEQTIPDENVQPEGRRGPSMQSKHVAPPPPPPRAPFDCPICMGPFVEEVTTKCGHVFYEDCIRNAISVQSSCPTCRRKVTYGDLIRIYLPSGN